MHWQDITGEEGEDYQEDEGGHGAAALPEDEAGGGEDEEGSLLQLAAGGQHVGRLLHRALMSELLQHDVAAKRGTVTRGTWALPTFIQPTQGVRGA